jgi:hypothetical protein
MGIISGAVAAYLVGCVPIARLASRYVAGRPVEPWVAGLADVVKGFAAVALFAPVGSLHQALIVTAVVAGDQWPVFGREVGRSGHWTFLGAMTVLTPMAPVIWAVLWALGFVASGHPAAHPRIHRRLAVRRHRPAVVRDDPGAGPVRAAPRAGRRRAQAPLEFGFLSPYFVATYARQYLP